MAKPEVDVYLSTQELSDLVRRTVAAREGIPLPVAGDVHWLWSPGVGAVARVVNLRHVPNVRALRVVR
jgi:hypothetical protein